ncbi:MAG: hypothetical protein ACLUD2_09840 [Clostridium sp.]
MATKVYELIAPCHFGLEAVLKKEILDLGYEIAQVEDGKVTFLGDAEAICRANIFPAHDGAYSAEGGKL